VGLVRKGIDGVVDAESRQDIRPDRLVQQALELPVS
jgi:hypothetical protein